MRFVEAFKDELDKVALLSQELNRRGVTLPPKGQGDVMAQSQRDVARKALAKKVHADTPPEKRRIFGAQQGTAIPAVPVGA